MMFISSPETLSDLPVSVKKLCDEVLLYSPKMCSFRNGMELVGSSSSSNIDETFVLPRPTGGLVWGLKEVGAARFLDLMIMLLTEVQLPASTSGLVANFLCIFSADYLYRYLTFSHVLGCVLFLP